MLATISPASVHVDETLATLRYACQARAIVNRVKVNEDPHDKIIRELRAEVGRLTALRQDYEREKRLSASNTANTAPARKIIIETSVDESEVEALKQQLAETERQLNKAQKSWAERLKEAEDQRKSEMRLLKRRGLAMELSTEHKQACLVNLAADPMLSGTLFYIIPPGLVKIGCSRNTAGYKQPDIVLEGPLVGYHHCTIENTNGRLYVIPDDGEFETFLNGELVKCRQEMYHGDRLVIGGSHYFRISNPFCAKQSDFNMVVDFQLAHQEILQKQEEQLRRELDEEKRAAFTQIEVERAANERKYKERMEVLELEQFKFECNKEMLETEKKALEEKPSEPFEYTPSYKSTLLDDINQIMQNPSEKILHKTQLMVKEATHRCRSLGLQLEFKQSQILDEFGIFSPVVLVIDRQNAQKAEWPIARLAIWLEVIRDNEIEKNNIFKSFDIEWTTLGENIDESINGSLNSSRISLILKQPMQRIRGIFSSGGSNQKNKSVLNSSGLNGRKMLTYDDEEQTPNKSSLEEPNFKSSAYHHIRDMYRSMTKLKELCDQYGVKENKSPLRNKMVDVDHVRSTVNEMEDMLNRLQVQINENVLNRSSPAKSPSKTVRFFMD